MFDSAMVHAFMLSFPLTASIEGCVALGSCLLASIEGYVTLKVEITHDHWSLLAGGARHLRLRRWALIESLGALLKSL